MINDSNYVHLHFVILNANYKDTTNLVYKYEIVTCYVITLIYGLYLTKCKTIVKL